MEGVLNIILVLFIYPLMSVLLLTPNNIMNDLKPTPANSTPLTPVSFLDRAAVVYTDSPSVVYGDVTYTWAETRVRCLRVASSIVSLGFGRDGVVSVMAPNVPAAYELHFAVPMSGAVLNNINTRLDSRTVSVLLQHSESRVVFVYDQLLPVVLQALSLMPSDHPRPVLFLISDSSSGYNDTFTTYEEMVRKGDPEFKWVRPASDYAPIVLNYTSGTTSSPKGVVHCHKGSFIMAMDSLIDWAMPKQPVFLWTLPMFHSNGWTFTWGMAAVGGTNVCLNRFDGASVFAAIRRHHVTHMCAAPVVLNMMIYQSPKPKKLANPVHILTGGSPPPAPIISRAESLGFIIGHGYGLTETGGVIISNTWNRNSAKLKTRQGVRTLGLTQMDVINPTTTESVPHDGKSVGEIVLRGGSIMLGYLKDPKTTSSCMGNDGWFRTGDLGVVHKDGYLEIKDRSKDIIISGGENISSVEVESVIYTFPRVREVAVVAQPDEFWGETPCAFVNLEGVKFEMETRIIDYCREKMPHYMVPKTVVFTDELPKTSTGKVQKFMLREMAKGLKSSGSEVEDVSTSFASRL